MDAAVLASIRLTVSVSPAPQEEMDAAAAAAAFSAMGDEWDLLAQSFARAVRDHLDEDHQVSGVTVISQVADHEPVLMLRDPGADHGGDDGRT